MVEASKGDHRAPKWGCRKAQAIVGGVEGAWGQVHLGAVSIALGAKKLQWQEPESGLWRGIALGRVSRFMQRVWICARHVVCVCARACANECVCVLQGPGCPRLVGHARNQGG